jgi:hypothetical protein
MTRFRALLVGLGQIGCGYDSYLPFVLDQPRSSARTFLGFNLCAHPYTDSEIDQVVAAFRRVWTYMEARS